MKTTWTKQLTWLRIVHFGEWCLRLALRTYSGACQKWMNEWMLQLFPPMPPSTLQLMEILFAFIIKNPISPICLKIHSQSNPDLLGGVWKKSDLWWDFCKPGPWRMWCKHSSSQFQVCIHRDWGIMGYNDVIVCVTVINLTNRFFFIGLDQSRLTNLIHQIVDYVTGSSVEQLLDHDSGKSRQLINITWNSDSPQFRQVLCQSANESSPVTSADPSLPCEISTLPYQTWLATHSSQSDGHPSK